MKKFLSLCLIASLFIQPAFCAIVETATPVELQSEMLKNKYAGYELQFENTGKNPVKIISVEVKNIVNNTNQVLVSDALQGINKNNKLIYLDLLTFGITGFVGNAKNNKILKNQKIALAEAATYELNFENLKNEIVMPNRSKSLKFLIPIAETPNISAVFQDTKTNEYMNAKTK